MNMYFQLTTNAEEHVTNLFKASDTSSLLYHNIDHTQSVVSHCMEIAEHYRLPENEKAILLIAAWLHDTGHLYMEPLGHEEKSVEIMKEFMAVNSVESDFTEAVGACIRATKLDEKPQNLLQEIIKDADTYNLGTTRFKETNKLIRKEYERRGLVSMLKDFDLQTLQLLEMHQFYTSYCQEQLSTRKEKNLVKYRAKVEKAIAKRGPVGIQFQPVDKNAKESTQKGLVNKGIQTMLRLTSENHLELSSMADGKANILISVNAIIISVILTVLIRKIEVDRHLAIPTFIFLFFSVATIILAILATRPQVTVGNFSRNDVMHKKTNLLFFGNFFKTSLDEYKWAMSTLMQDPEYLYGNLVTDIHSLGVVLGRKYKLLRKAYNLFMVGIIVSVIAFILAIMLHDPQTNTVINSDASSPL
ncbi:MAG: Pycsar system effector family protein [Chitinophagaceae bacterium]